MGYEHGHGHELEPEPEPEAEPEHKPELNPEPEHKPEPNLKSDPETNFDFESNAESKLESEPGTETNIGNANIAVVEENDSIFSSMVPLDATNENAISTADEDIIQDTVEQLRSARTELDEALGIIMPLTTPEITNDMVMREEV